LCTAGIRWSKVLSLCILCRPSLLLGFCDCDDVPLTWWLSRVRFQQYDDGHSFIAPYSHTMRSRPKGICLPRTCCATLPTHAPPLELRIGTTVEPRIRTRSHHSPTLGALAQLYVPFSGTSDKKPKHQSLWCVSRDPPDKLRCRPIGCRFAAPWLYGEPGDGLRTLHRQARIIYGRIWTGLIICEQRIVERVLFRRAQRGTHRRKKV